MVEAGAYRVYLQPSIEGSPMMSWANRPSSSMIRSIFIEAQCILGQPRLRGDDPNIVRPAEVVPVFLQSIDCLDGLDDRHAQAVGERLTSAIQRAASDKGFAIVLLMSCHRRLWYRTFMLH